MKKLLISFSLLYLTTAGIHAQLKCPIEAFGVKYDKNSPFGDEICGALKNLNSVVDGLGKNASSIINKVNAQVDDFKKDYLPKEPVSREAMVSFARANAKFKSISARIDRLVQDKQCGAPGVYKGMVRLFLNTEQTLKELQAIGSNSFNALKELKPIATRTAEITTDLVNLAGIVAGRSPQIDASIKKLIELVKSLQKDLEKVSNLDFIGFTTSATGLATGVGPFLFDCSTCAGTIGTSLTGMGGGGGAAGAGTATPYTGVGAAFIPAGGITAGLSAAFGAIMASPACKGMAEKSAQIDTYVKDVTNFIKTTGELAEHISSNTKKIVETSEALKELIRVIGEESKPSVKKIQEKLVLISDDVKKTVAQFNMNVRPRIERMSGNTLIELSTNTKQLYECYKQFNAVGSMISQDMVDAAGDLVEAAAELSGAKNLYYEMVEEIDNAGNAFVKNVKEDWGKMDQQKDKFFKKLLGDKPTDAGAVAGHLAELATNFNAIKDLLDDIQKLAGKTGKFAEASLTALLKALPSKSDVAVASARMKMKSDKALEKIAAAEAKIKAQEKTAGL